MKDAERIKELKKQRSDAQESRKRCYEAYGQIKIERDQLRAELEKTEKREREAIADCLRLSAENLTMREALEWYANSRAYDDGWDRMTDSVGADGVNIYDGGEKAEVALKLPHTAFLAEKMRLMERYIKATKCGSSFREMLDLQKALDAHLETEKR
jgi:hypothetical protein